MTFRCSPIRRRVSSSVGSRSFYFRSAVAQRPALYVVARWLGLLLALLGTLTTIEHLANVDLRIDTLLFSREWGQRASAAPMRMGLPAATSFIMIGVGIALATWGGSARKIAAALALGVVGIVSLSLIGYWYGADQLYLIPRYTGIAWQSSTMIMSLGARLDCRDSRVRHRGDPFAR